jgi:hypothetical protein
MLSDASPSVIGEQRGSRNVFLNRYRTLYYDVLV